MNFRQKNDHSNRSEEIEYKSRKRILMDNFLGGITWGVGSVLGATIIVGILGVVIVRSRSIPLVGDVVKVVVNEIQLGLQEIKNGTN